MRFWINEQEILTILAINEATSVHDQEIFSDF